MVKRATRSRLIRWWTSVRIAGALLGIGGLVFGVWSYLTIHRGAFSFTDFAAEYGANITTTLIGFAVAALVIDWLGERRTEQQRKQAIIQQMCSPVKDAALEAVRIARNEGWLKDGSLRWAQLAFAHLPGADLSGADLRDVNLYGAHLQNANLSTSDLQGANIVDADLQGASLFLANCEGAYFNASRFDKATVLPDDSRWSTDASLERFTDRRHPDFWWIRSVPIDL